MLQITAEKAEELILFYEAARYKALEGRQIKIRSELARKAKELGFSVISAWRLVAFAKRVGMLEETL